MSDDQLVGLSVPRAREPRARSVVGGRVTISDDYLRQRRKRISELSLQKLFVRQARVWRCLCTSHAGGRDYQQQAHKRERKGLHKPYGQPKLQRLP